MNALVDGAERFTVGRRLCSKTNFGRRAGWVVFCDGRPLTIAFETEEEAQQRCAHLAEAFSRWGW